MAYYLILTARVFLAPLILVWPTAAIILSFFLDVIDADFAYKVITKKQYQIIDKIVDSWVYIFELIIGWRMIGEFGVLLTALFVWRMIGLAVFLKFRKRHILLIFGNYFENIFFLLYFATVYKPLNFLISTDIALYASIFAVVLAKAGQEWFIHVADLSIREDFFKSRRHWKVDKNASK